MKPITTRQLRSLYWPAWRAAEKALLAAHATAEDAEATRREIHAAVAGKPVSSKELTNRQLDEVLAKFRAISNPLDGRYQARQADQPACRIRWKIEQLRREHNLSAEYIDTVARRVAWRPLAHCDDVLARKVLAALTYHHRRHPSEPVSS
jgi:hypothetical protein